LIELDWGLGMGSSMGRTDEVLQDQVGHGAATAVALDHVHLVRGPGVDITVNDVGDIDVGREGAHGAATAPVAVDVLDEDVLGGTLCRD
jgi:hypothetical protein